MFSKHEPFLLGSEGEAVDDETSWVLRIVSDERVVRWEVVSSEG